MNSISARMWQNITAETSPTTETIITCNTFWVNCWHCCVGCSELFWCTFDFSYSFVMFNKNHPSLCQVSRKKHIASKSSLVTADMSRLLTGFRLLDWRFFKRHRQQLLTKQIVTIDFFFADKWAVNLAIDQKLQHRQYIHIRGSMLKLSPFQIITFAYVLYLFQGLSPGQ